MCNGGKSMLTDAGSNASLTSCFQQSAACLRTSVSSTVIRASRPLLTGVRWEVDETEHVAPEQQ